MTRVSWALMSGRGVSIILGLFLRLLKPPISMAHGSVVVWKERSLSFPCRKYSERVSADLFLSVLCHQLRWAEKKDE